MDLGEVGWGDVDWIGLVQDRNRSRRALVNSVLNLRDPLNIAKLSSGLISSWPSSSAQLHRVSYLVRLQGMLVLSYTVASLYYNCCTDGSTNPGNFGYSLVNFTLFVLTKVPRIV
jgi:hypothetical protein